MYNKIECIYLTCDNCGEIFTENHNGFSIFLDEINAHDEADNDGWYLHGKHYCSSCHTIDDDDILIIKPIAPIFEVIAEFPNNEYFALGNKITFETWHANYWQHIEKDCQGEKVWLSTWFEQYPHLFKRIYR